jgi:hypothetical protein
MRNLLSEEEFKTAIQANDKKNRKNAEISQVIDVIQTVIADIVFRFIDHLKNAEPNKYSLSVSKEFDEIIAYSNELLNDISFTYKSVTYQFDKYCTMYSEKNGHKNHL